MVYGGSTEDELEKYISDTSSSFVFTLDIFQDKFVKIAGKAGIKQIIVTSITESMSLPNRIGARVVKNMKPISLPEDSRFVSWKQFFRQAIETKKTCHNGDAPAVITYTGGTTGGSKAQCSATKRFLRLHSNISLAKQAFAAKAHGCSCYLYL